MKTLQKTIKSSLFDKFTRRSFNAKQEFVQRFKDCETHGQYPENVMINGVEHWDHECKDCRQERINKYLFGKAAIPLNFTESDFQNYIVSNSGQETAKETCFNYASNFKPDVRMSPSVIVFGNSGTGKNHLATAIIKIVMAKGYTATYTQLFDYLDKFWSFEFGNGRAEWINELSNIDLLMIDEIGRASASKSANDALFKILQERALKLKPTIVATNLNLDELEGLIGVASYNRLCEYEAVGIPFTWEKYKSKRLGVRVV